MAMYTTESCELCDNCKSMGYWLTYICRQVQATHKYIGEDCDELSFDPDEIITVVPFDDPEEQVKTTTYFVNASVVKISVCISSMNVSLS